MNNSAPMRNCPGGAGYLNATLINRFTKIIINVTKKGSTD